MSVIDKYPFINAVLSSLSDEDLESLKECVNGSGADNVFKSILAGSPYLLTNEDQGVYPVNLEVSKLGSAQSVYPGFLIYNSLYCVLISFATERNQILTVLDLHLVNGLWKYEIKPFELSITDLRSELFDVAHSGEGGGSSGDGPKIYEVEDIEAIPAEILNELKVGDVVSYLNHSEIDLYTVVKVYNPEFRTGVCLMCFTGTSSTYVAYALNDNEWELDFIDDTGYPTVYMIEDISDLSSDFFELIGPDSILLTYADEKWTPIYTGGEDGIYFQKIGVDAITMVHYVDEVFDDSYGTDGFLTIPLGGGGNHPNVYEVDDLNNIQSEILDALKVGDILVLTYTDGASFGYVNIIEDGYLEIYTIDAYHKIISCHTYHKEDDVWNYDSEESYQSDLSEGLHAYTVVPKDLGSPIKDQQFIYLTDALFETPNLSAIISDLTAKGYTSADNSYPITLLYLNSGTDLVQLSGLFVDQNTLKATGRFIKLSVPSVGTYSTTLQITGSVTVTLIV